MPRHRKKKSRQPTVAVEAAAAPEAEGGEQPFTTQASPKLKVQLWGDDHRTTNPMADLDASPVAAADSEYGDSPAGNSTADGIVEEPASPPPETRAPEYDDLIHQIEDVKQRIVAAQQITGQYGAVEGGEEGADTAAALVPRLQAQLRRKEQRLRELTAELDRAEDSNSRMQAKLQLLQSDSDAVAADNAELRCALDKLTYEVEEKEGAAQPKRAAASPSQLWEKSAELSKANKELEAELARSQQIADVRGKQVDKLATARKDALATLGQVTAERDELASQLQRLQHGTPAAKRSQANAQLARDKAAAQQEAAELRGEVDNLRRQLSSARHNRDDNQQDGQLAESYELLKRDTALLRGEVEELTAENAGLRAEIAALRAGAGGSEAGEVAALRAELEEVKAAKAESDRHLRELRAANDMDLEALQRELQDEIQGDGTYAPAQVAEPASSDDGREDGSESEAEVNPTPASKEQPQAAGQVADSPATEYSPVKARALNAEFEATTHQPDTPAEAAAEQVDADAKAEEEEESYVPAKKLESSGEAAAQVDPLIAAISPRSNNQSSRDPRAESPRSTASRGSAAGAGNPSSPRSAAASSPRSQASPRTTKACDHYLIYHKRMAASTCKCGVCGKSISRMGQCYKCSKCKLKAHTDCVTRTDGGEAYLPSPARS